MFLKTQYNYFTYNTLFYATCYTIELNILLQNKTCKRVLKVLQGQETV